MVNLNRLLKPYRDASASNSVLAPHRFIEDRVFLPKGNHLCFVLRAEGIDDECLTDKPSNRIRDPQPRPGERSMTATGCTNTLSSKIARPFMPATPIHRTQFAEPYQIATARPVHA